MVLFNTVITSVDAFCICPSDATVLVGVVLFSLT